MTLTAHNTNQRDPHRFDNMTEQSKSAEREGHDAFPGVAYAACPYADGNFLRRMLK